MTRNPFFNAVLAAGYIALIVSGMFYSQRLHIPEPNILIPMAMLSLLTLSVAMMGVIFFYQPVTLFLEGKKKEAVRLLAQTLGTFAAITAVFFALLLVI